MKNDFNEFILTPYINKLKSENYLALERSVYASFARLGQMSAYTLFASRLLLFYSLSNSLLSLSKT